jgi:hypothetical protein
VNDLREEEEEEEEDENVFDLMCVHSDSVSNDIDEIEFQFQFGKQHDQKFGHDEE